RDLEPLLYTVTGDEAALHAFRVASSLDSMVLGEPQILGQVKDAFALAQSCRTVGPVLHSLMSQAFAVAKRVRSDTEAGRHAVSVSLAAVARAGAAVPSEYLFSVMGQVDIVITSTAAGEVIVSAREVARVLPARRG